MDNTISFTGGARIGWVNASWPLAKLTATRDRLEITASILGTYSFAPEQVLSIERFSYVPLLAWGIRIRHVLPNYPKRVIFWCAGSNPASVIEAIQRTGFASTADPSTAPPHPGIPVRWQTLLAIAVVWNALYLIDTGFPPRWEQHPGWPSFLGVFLVFAGSIAVWKVPWVQRLLLKPGRSPDEIKHWLRLLTLVTGIMSAVFLVGLLSGLF